MYTEVTHDCATTLSCATNSKNRNEHGIAMTRSLSVSEQKAFSEELEQLGRSCRNLKEVNSALYSGDFVNEDNVNEWIEELELVASRSQDLILRAEKLFGDFKSLDEWVRQHDHVDDLEPVLAFALGRESDSLSHLFKWLEVDILKLHRDLKVGSDYLPCIRHNTYNKFRIGLENFPQRNDSSLADSPKLFANGEFRSFDIFSICFGGQLSKTMRGIIESSIHQPDTAYQWINAISTSKYPAVKAYLTGILSNYSVDGLSELRSFLIGAHLPSGEECCTRQDRLLSFVAFDSASSDEITTKLEQIKLNTEYYEKIFYPELNDWLCKKSYLLTESEDFQHGQRSANQLTRLLRHCELTQAEMIALAMSATASFSKGKMMDLEKAEDAAKVRLVLDDVLRKRSASGSIMATENNFRHVVLTAVVRNLPLKLLRAAAAEEDLRKVMLYEMTGNARILNSLKDHRRLPGLMSNDLGL